MVRGSGEEWATALPQQALRAADARPRLGEHTGLFAQGSHSQLIQFAACALQSLYCDEGVKGMCCGLALSFIRCLKGVV